MSLFVPSRMRYAVPLLLIAAALAGCSGAGRALPPPASRASASSALLAPLGVPPAPPSMQIPRRPAFVSTTPAQPSSALRRTSSTGHPAFFNGEAALSNGVYYLQLPNGNIFGYYSYLPDPHYIYHFDLGYEYVIDANDRRGGLYTYDFASGHWWYTGAQYPFPYAYDFTLSAFVYYYPDTSNPQHYTTSPRFFYNFTASQIVTIPSAMPAPAVGYLSPASGGSLAGILDNVNSSLMVVGISTAQAQGGPDQTVPTDNVSVSYGTTVLSARRAPQRSTKFDHGPRSSAERPVDGPQAFRALTAGLRRSAASARRPSAMRRASSLGTTIGSTNGFWVLNGAIGTGSNSSVQRAATLKAATAHGYIWVDDTLTSLTASDITAIGNAFENGYASDTAHFGSSAYTTSAPGYANYTLQACDSNGRPTGQNVPYYITPTDSKPVVLVLDVNNLGTGVGGYFAPLNYFYQSALNCYIGNGYTAQTVPRSNEAPMIVVGYYTPNGSQFENGEDVVRGMAHEYQHEINFVNHAILNDVNVEDTWINEGLSMLAQDLAVERMYPGVQTDVDDAMWRAGQYLQAPQNYSLTAFTGSSGGTQQYNCSACYGLEYLFQRYLYDRFGGDAYLRRMLGAQQSYANLAQATGIDPAQAISDFAVALAASGTNATNDPRFGFASLNLHGTYTDQFGDGSSFTGPSALPLSSGSNAYLLGSFFYLNADSTAAGKTVDVKDPVGSFGLRAAVVQH